jgi:hypothetical protein
VHQLFWAVWVNITGLLNDTVSVALVIVPLPGTTEGVHCELGQVLGPNVTVVGSSCAVNEGILAFP